MEPRHAQARKKTSEEPRTGWWMDGYLRGEGGGAAEGEEGGGGGRGGAAVACRGKRGIRHRHLSLSAAVSLSRTQHTSQAKLSPCACPRRSPGSVFNGVPRGLAGVVNVLCLACARARPRLYYRLCLSPSLAPWPRRCPPRSEETVDVDEADTRRRRRLWIPARGEEEE